MLNKIPDTIKKFIKGKKYSLDNIGKSTSKVIIFDDIVLKINKVTNQSKQNIEMMNWLGKKIPVPKVIYYEIVDGYEYLLMSKIEGQMACSEHFLENPTELLKILSDALKMLWKADISDCPKNRTIEKELEEAKYRIANNLVDLADCDPETFGDNGFVNPQELLNWLNDNKPNYEPVLSHGDFCLPNIFIKNNEISGFIDLGDAGIGDKYRDIALCYRSLRNNFNGTYGGKVYPDFTPDKLFEYLEIDPDYDKIRFYLLLDELF